MADALPTQKTMRGARGSAAEARITGTVTPPNVYTTLPFEPKPGVNPDTGSVNRTGPAPVAPVMRNILAKESPIPEQPSIKNPLASASETVEQRILRNLNNGWKNSKDLFADRAKYNAAYGYAEKTPEQRAILDSFWSSKKGGQAEAAKPEQKGSGNLSEAALGVVDKESQNAFKLPAVAAAEKAEQLINNQEELNAKMLANLERSTSPILAKTREQYAEFTSMMSKAKADNAAQVAALKDLQAGQNQEIDIAKAGQIRAMEASMAAKGITGYAAMAAVAQASGDPKFIQAATDLKKKYITDLSAASDKLNDTLTGILNNQTALTASEAATLKDIRTQKDLLDTAIKDLKKAAIDSSFKPLEDYATAKTGVAQANDVTNFDVRAEQAIWLKSDEPTKIATLQRKLFSESGGAAERGLVTNEDYAKAAKMGSFTEGQAYLESIIASKKQTNALGLSSSANPVKIDQPVGNFSAASVQSVVDRYSALKTKGEREAFISQVDSQPKFSPEDKAVIKKILNAVDKANPINEGSTVTAPAATVPAATVPATAKPRAPRGSAGSATETKLMTGVDPKTAPIKGEDTFWKTKSAPETAAEKMAADAKKAKEEADMKRAVALQNDENMKKRGEDIMNNANRSFYGFETRTSEEQSAALDSMKKGTWYQIQGTRYAMKNNDGNLYIYDPLRKVNFQTMWEAAPEDVLVKTMYDRSGRPGFLVKDMIKIK